MRTVEEILAEVDYRIGMLKEYKEEYREANNGRAITNCSNRIDELTRLERLIRSFMSMEVADCSCGNRTGLRTKRIRGGDIHTICGECGESIEIEPLASE